GSIQGNPSLAPIDPLFFRVRGKVAPSRVADLERAAQHFPAEAPPSRAVGHKIRHSSRDPEGIPIPILVPIPNYVPYQESLGVRDEWGGLHLCRPFGKSLPTLRGLPGLV